MSKLIKRKRVKTAEILASSNKSRKGLYIILTPSKGFTPVYAK